MTTQATPYAFPMLRKLDDAQVAAQRAREAQIEAAYNDAIARGVSEGISRGRHEAQIEAQELLEQSHREGFERGHAAGLAEMHQVTAALRDALRDFELQRAQIVAEAEEFCVEVALAIVARLAETNDLRTEFVVRSVRSALSALAPSTPTAIFVHPGIQPDVARPLEDLPVRYDDALSPGGSRVEAGRLVVQSSIEEAFEQIRSAVLDLKASRRPARGEVEGGLDASDD